MRTTRPPRIRLLRLLSTAFLVTAMLASGGTASAARKKTKTPADDKAETPAQPAAAAPAQEAPAQETPAPAEAAAPAPAPAPSAPEPVAPVPPPAPAAMPAPAPAPAQPEAGAASPQHKRSGKITELGLSPQTTTYAADNAGAPPVASEVPAEDWGFRFHGFFRGPMRLSMDTKSGHGLQFHAPPVTPDLNYTTWSYTNNNPGPWGEMMFQYGNNRAIMTMAIASYNITSGSWRELQDQLGIDRAFLTLNFPDALGDVGKMTWNVGVFSDRYGAMGKYDGGAYDTYMIGRTRVAGATGTFDLDVDDDIKVIAEGGVGAKMDVPQWVPAPYTSWQPYPGYVQMGTTMLAHAHVGAMYQEMLTLTGHAMYTWTMDAMRTDLNNPNSDVTGRPANYASPEAKTGAFAGSARDGHLLILGADLRLDGGWMGLGYLGYSHNRAVNVGVLQDTIETMHSQGGWQYAANYTGKATGTGTLDSIGFQYTFSLAAFQLRPQSFWGQGTDFTVQVFGIYNHISGLDPSEETYIKQQGRDKLKWGAQLLGTPFAVMSIGARFDRVQPNMDDSTRTFNVISPRLIFRTAFVTHEQIQIQYQYYMYGDWYTKPYNTFQSLPYPYGQIGNLWSPLLPDKHTFTIAASMWW
jgi:hypothetical protein